MTLTYSNPDPPTREIVQAQVTNEVVASTVREFHIAGVWPSDVHGQRMWCLNLAASLAARHVLAEPTMTWAIEAAEQALAWVNGSEATPSDDPQVGGAS